MLKKATAALPHQPMLLSFLLLFILSSTVLANPAHGAGSAPFSVQCTTDSTNPQVAVNLSGTITASGVSINKTECNGSIGTGAFAQYAVAGITAGSSLDFSINFDVTPPQSYTTTDSVYRTEATLVKKQYLVGHDVYDANGAFVENTRKDLGDTGNATLSGTIVNSASGLKSTIGFQLVLYCYITYQKRVYVISTGTEIESREDTFYWSVGSIYKGESGTATTTTTPTAEAELTLTYPAGQSPKVFTSGWTFGASCLLKLAGGTTEDLSEKVKWSGTGVFTPATGSRSAPVFTAPGANTITLSITIDGKEYTQTTNIEAVSPSNYAALGNNALCPADAHGCPACPHTVSGPLIEGSPNVSINNVPAARVGDGGVHAACCSGNLFKIISGDQDVLIDGLPAARLGDTTRHCGGLGRIASAGGIAAATDSGLRLNNFRLLPGPLAADAGTGAISGTATGGSGAPIAGLAVWAYPADGGEPLWAETGAAGHYSITGLAPGQYRVYFSIRVRSDATTPPTWSDGPYIAQWYATALTFDQAQQVTVSAGSIATADAELAAAGSISGSIQNGSGSGIEKATVTAYGAATKTVLWHWTDASGAYTITGLPADTYTLFVQGSMVGYADTWYGGALATATPVTVADSQQVAGINVSLAAGGSIAGTVTDPQNKPVAGIAVQAVNTATNLGGTAVTVDSGAYAISGLPGGSYKIRVLGQAQELTNIWYPAATGWDNAEILTLGVGAALDGIDVRLSEPGCAAAQLLGRQSPQLDRLRAFRDGTLSQSALGCKLIQAYYNNAGSINAALERSPALRAAVRWLLETIAPLVVRQEK